MKLIIDINDHEYMGIKEYPDNITSYPVTIHLYDAVRNGTPLDKVIEDIKADIEKAMEDFYYDEHDLGVRAGFRFALDIIDNHISGKEQE